MEKFFSSLYEFVNDCICVLNEQGEIIYKNPAFRENNFFKNENNFKSFFEANKMDYGKWLKDEKKETELICFNEKFVFKKSSILWNKKEFYVINTVPVELSNEKNIELSKVANLIEKTLPQNEFFYIYSFSPNQCYRFVSSNVESITGFRPSEFYGNPNLLIQSVVTDDNPLKEHEKRISEISDDNNLNIRSTITYSIRNKKGEIVWLQDTCMIQGKDSKYAIGFVRDITDIKVSEQTYLNLLNNLPVSYAVLNRDGKIIFCNNLLLQLINYPHTKEKFLEEGKHYSEFLVKDFHQVAEERVSKLLSEKSPNDFIFYELQDYNKNKIPCQVRSIPFIYEGQPSMLTTIVDVTPIKKYEEEKLRRELLSKHKAELEEKLYQIQELNENLQLQKQRFAEFIHASGHLAWIVDKDFRFQFFNDNFASVFLTNNFVLPQIGKTGSEVITDSEKRKEYEDFWIPLYKRVLNGEFVEVEKVDKSDENILIRTINLFPLYKGKNVTEIGCLAKDVSEKVLSRKMLDQQIFEMKSLVEAGPFYFWSINPKKELVNYNSNYEKLYYSVYGKKPKIFTRVDANHIYSDEGIKAIHTSYEEAFKGKFCETEVKVMTTDSIEKYLTCYFVPVFNEDQSVEKILVMAFDSTEKNKMLKEIQHQRETIQVSLREKELLLKELHHRVKNNLQVISSILNLQSRHVKDKETFYVLEETKSRIRSMSLVHENLYKSSSYDFLNINNYLRDIFYYIITGVYNYREDADFQFKSDDIFLSTELAVPLGLIFNELVTNSIKHGLLKQSNGNKKLYVRISMEGNNAHLTITDSGNGFDKEILHNLDKLNSLGMTLVRDLSYQMGARLDVENIPGNNTVSLVFPIQEQYGKNGR